MGNLMKKNLTTELILNKKFTPDMKGYNGHEVDSFLDLILEDYRLIEAFMKEELPLLKSQETFVQGLKNKIRDLEIQVAEMKDKVSVINANKTTEINQDNFLLIKKIGIYEKELFKLGIDPNKLK
jgi:DivIVA domain-containing protein